MESSYQHCLTDSVVDVICDHLGACARPRLTQLAVNLLKQTSFLSRHWLSVVSAFRQHCVSYFLVECQAFEVELFGP